MQSRSAVNRIMKTIASSLAILTLLAAVAVHTDLAHSTQRSSKATAVYDVRAFGAKGDGQTLDTPAINKAIDAATAAGGGTVDFRAGTYLSVSIHLKSNITLRLDQGATMLAADTVTGKVTYDLPEPNEWDMYQDFGHSHWQNSLIWGIGIENVAIIGQGRIDGKGLTRRSPGPRKPRTAGETPASLAGNVSPLGETADVREMDGLGNKAISLKLSH